MMRRVWKEKLSTWLPPLLLIGLVLGLLQPLWTPGMPRDNDWARVLLGWVADGERDEGFPYAWDPRFEGGSPNHRHPCQGYTGLWTLFLPLPAPAALRSFVTLLALICTLSFHHFLRRTLALGTLPSLFGATYLATCPWWRQRLVGGDVELVTILLLPSCLLLLIPGPDGRRTRGGCILAAFVGAFALMGGKPIWLLVLLLPLATPFLARRLPASRLPGRKALGLFTGLTLAMAAPRLVSLGEGMLLARRQSRDAAASPWGRLARQRQLDRRDGFGWRLAPSPALEGSSAMSLPPAPLPRRAPSLLGRLPVYGLAVAGLPRNLRTTPTLVALGLAWLWIEEPFHLGLTMPVMTNPFSGNALSFRPRYLGFFLELLLALLAARAIHPMAARRRVEAVLLVVLCLLPNLLPWQQAMTGPFGPSPRRVAPPCSDPCPLMAVSEEGLGGLQPIVTLEGRIHGLGIVQADTWAPFPSPVEPRWLLDSDGFHDNEGWGGHVRRSEGSVQRAELVDGAINRLRFWVESKGTVRLVLNFLYCDGLVVEGGRVESEGGLLCLCLQGDRHGFVTLRYEGTPWERGAWVLAVGVALSALVALAWPPPKGETSFDMVC